jgi:uncharacterized membrane protein
MYRRHSRNSKTTKIENLKKQKKKYNFLLKLFLNDGCIKFSPDDSNILFFTLALIILFQVAIFLVLG